MTITIDQLSKRYGSSWVIRKGSYTFDAPNVYALQGPNGSGKSTLLKLLAGFLTPSYGSILYKSSNGASISRDEIYKKIAFVAPYIDLPDQLTVQEITVMHGKLKGFVDNKTPEEVVDHAYLTTAKNLFIHELSSGMLQRLKLALTIFSQAEILIIDEPGMNLDSKAKAWYLNHLLRYHQNRLIIIASNETADFPTVNIPIHINFLQ
jgi:ABC-type multidrug transport system ATPase subunit